MQSVEKQSESDHHSSHCFPSIEKSIDNTSGLNEPDCDAFRPLFQVSDPSSGQSDIDSGNQSTAGSGQDTVAQIRQQRFIEGHEAGKADACNIVRKELDAPVHQFINESDLFSNCYSHITQNYSVHIVALALAIVKKILGDRSKFNSEHFDPICGQLHSFLKTKYRLSAKFNRDDIESVTDLLACINPQWKPSDALDIAGVDEIRAGCVDLDNCDASIEAAKNEFKQKVEITLDSL